MSATETKNAITLKGSAKMVCEYLNFGINSILYQRGVYPPETFKADEKFGVSLLMSQDDKVKLFLTAVLEQVEEWMNKKWVHKISMFIFNVQNKEALERWDFNLEHDDTEMGDGDKTASAKPVKQVQKEIRDVLKQIISTIAILPLLDCLCSFDIQIYTSSDWSIPDKWDQTQAAEIANAQTVQLRSFATGFHSMDTFVTYKMDL